MAVKDAWGGGSISSLKYARNVNRRYNKRKKIDEQNKKLRAGQKANAADEAKSLATRRLLAADGKSSSKPRKELTKKWGTYEKSNAGRGRYNLSSANVSKNKDISDTTGSSKRRTAAANRLINRRAGINDRVRSGRYAGKYYGRDEFKGDLTQLYAWKRAGKPKDVNAFMRNYNRKHLSVNKNLG